jgi:hypothetical protein
VECLALERKIDCGGVILRAVRLVVLNMMKLKGEGCRGERLVKMWVHNLLEDENVMDTQSTSTTTTQPSSRLPTTTTPHTASLFKTSLPPLSSSPPNQPQARHLSSSAAWWLQS